MLRGSEVVVVVSCAVTEGAEDDDGRTELLLTLVVGLVSAVASSTVGDA